MHASFGQILLTIAIHLPDGLKEALERFAYFVVSSWRDGNVFTGWEAICQSESGGLFLLGAGWGGPRIS